MRSDTIITWSLSLGCKDSSIYTNSMTPCINKTKGKGKQFNRQRKTHLSIVKKTKQTKTWERLGRRIKANLRERREQDRPGTNTHSHCFSLSRHYSFMMPGYTPALYLQSNKNFFWGGFSFSLFLFPEKVLLYISDWHRTYFQLTTILLS